MSRDRDPQQRLWLSLGYGGATAPQPTWRYWAKPGEKFTWIIAAPNDLARFEQRGSKVYYGDVEIISAETQWEATWRTLAFFYESVIPTVTPPPLAARKAT